MTRAICGCHLRGQDGATGIDPMLAALSDYGADDATWAQEGVGLGCRRAETEDGRTDRLTRFDPAAGLALAADARLDDRESLCDALGVPRPDRAEITDDELILRAYARWGRACPTRLLGDYAFAVWDAKRRVLFCARDHAGARPFYYARIPRGIVFASAVEAVLAAPGVSSELDEATVAAHLTRIEVNTTTRTFFKAVRKLPPGHALTIEGGEARRERHWHPERAPAARAASDDACAEEFLALYTRAVADRLRGPDPVGVHLSGGLDSSSIAVLAARELRRQGRPPPLAFSWLPTLGDRPPSESHAAEYDAVAAVCAQEGMQVFHRALSPGDVVAMLRRDGACPGVHIHPNEMAVQRCAAEQGVRVLLSGWGGDEGASFNGRGHRERLLLTGRWLKLLAEGRACEVNPLKFLAGVALPLVHPRLPRALRRLRRGDGPRGRRWLIDPAFARRVKPAPARIPRQVNVRDTQLWLLRNGHLSQRIEGWAASGAAHGLEYRYPLLDRRLLEFALGLPPEQFRRGPWSRWLMRHALRSVLPPELCWNPSKADPARHEPFIESFAEALPVVRRELASRAAPSRARYIDMPRLLERLDADLLRAKPQLMPIHNAVQFLDF